MNITTCPKCSGRVLPTSDNLCPACGWNVSIPVVENDPIPQEHSDSKQDAPQPDASTAVHAQPRQLSRDPNELLAQVQSIENKESELRSLLSAYHKKIYTLLGVGGGIFLLLGLVMSASGNAAFGGIATIVFVVVVFTLQNITRHGPSDQLRSLTGQKHKIHEHLLSLGKGDLLSEGDALAASTRVKAQATQTKTAWIAPLVFTGVLALGGAVFVSLGMSVRASGQGGTGWTVFGAILAGLAVWFGFRAYDLRCKSREAKTEDTTSEQSNAG